MLKTLRIHNFRTFLNAEFNFRQRHLVIGRNNSGKTNLCTALRFFSATGRLDLASAAGAAIPGSTWEIKNWAFDSDEIDISCVCTVPFDGSEFEYVYELTLVAGRDPSTQNAQGALRVENEQLNVTGPQFSNVTLLSNDGRQAQMLHEENHLKKREPRIIEAFAPADSTMLSKLYELNTNRRACAFRRYLGLWFYFAINPESMRYGWNDKSALSGGMYYNFRDLALAIFRLKNSDERRYRRIIEHAQMIEPGLRAINFLTGAETPVPFVELSGRNHAFWVGLSDGTLRCLALAYLAEMTSSTSVNSFEQMTPLVMIEEPENGLFPGQLRSIFELFGGDTSDGQYLFLILYLTPVAKYGIC